MQLTILALLLALAGATPTRASSSKKCAPGSYKLTETFEPLHYELSIEPDLESMSYRGSVDIEVRKIGELTTCLLSSQGIKSMFGHPKYKKIVLNARREFVEIDESSVSYTTYGRVYIGVESVCYDELLDNVVITFARSLRDDSVDGGVLHVGFTGKIQSKGSGLFVDELLDGEGKVTRQLLTKLEPLKAREVFPCFDDPKYLTSFKLAVVHPRDQTALSNGASKHEEIRETGNAMKLVTKFAVTPKMAIHSLALAIGPYEFAEKPVGVGRLVMFRVYTPPGRSNEALESLEAAASIWEEISDKYQLLKRWLVFERVDIVAAGALSRGVAAHLGLVAMDQELLLLNENSALSTKKLSKLLLGYAMARLKFAELLPAGSWREFWLNEGVAAWIGESAADRKFPELNLRLELKTSSQLNSIAEDTHKVVLRPSKLEGAEEVASFIESTTLRAKSKSLAEMIENHIGPKAFELAIHRMVRDHQQTRASNDLFVELLESSSSSNLPVAAFVNSWLDSEGHPLMLAEYDEATRSVVVSQRKYPNKDGKRSHWTTPIQLLVSAGDNGREEIVATLMKGKQESVKLPDWFDIRNQNHFVKLNPGAVGFYHVKYDQHLFNHLVYATHDNRLSLLDKVEFVKTTKDLESRALVSREDLEYLETALGAEAKSDLFA